MKVLLITPPFTQLNTPYPATAYLQGYLKSLGVECRQADLGIEVVLEVFSKAGLSSLFEEIEARELALSENAFRICMLRDAYLRTIDPVIAFLQHRDPTLAYAIVDRSFLPEAGRFKQVEDLDWAFGTLGIQDHARHLATLYLEDLGDLITETLDPHFGFSRYAERLGRTATHFDPLLVELNAPDTLISSSLRARVDVHLQSFPADLVCLSVPFPGNLFGAFKIAQHLRQHYPSTHIAMGGGFPNTELRSLSDPRVFDFIDFITLDDGEAPLRILLDHLQGLRPASLLKRTFTRIEGEVCYFNAAPEKDVPQRDTGAPDYTDLHLTRYLSVIEVTNPMHRLWSDGRWNKLTLAHGCYWGKCAFCDISLDYIQRYEPITPDILCDRIETIIAQTGQRGFHFVDEAAPPALMRDLALALLRRRITITWWTNIRFEKRFNPDLCRLLRASGCIAISGGLEVASDRLLEKMKKGVTVAQVARVANAFTQAGIMVHAYLMYGFPTQTAQETVDSLERVRQMFDAGVMHSAFWHRFAMTTHSPVGLSPAEYGVMDTGPEFGGFADNDRFHDDPDGADHDLFAEGLRVSLYNFMHGAGFDLPLQKWFAFKVPKPSVASDLIATSLADEQEEMQGSNRMFVWLGATPMVEGTENGGSLLELHSQGKQIAVELPDTMAEWLQGFLEKAMPSSDGEFPTWPEALASYPGNDASGFLGFWEGELGKKVREMGCLAV
jgi:radical SAM superfamily enzyme YgiQ (UPF0313 family)